MATGALIWSLRNGDRRGQSWTGRAPGEQARRQRGWRRGAWRVLARPGAACAFLDAAVTCLAPLPGPPAGGSQQALGACLRRACPFPRGEAGARPACDPYQADSQVTKERPVGALPRPGSQTSDVLRGAESQGAGCVRAWLWQGALGEGPLSSRGQWDPHLGHRSSHDAWGGGNVSDPCSAIWPPGSQSVPLCGRKKRVRRTRHVLAV